MVLFSRSGRRSSTAWAARRTPSATCCAVAVGDRELPELLDSATMILARQGLWKEAGVLAKRAAKASPTLERLHVVALTCRKAGDRAGFATVASLGLSQPDAAAPELIDFLLRLSTLTRDGLDWKKLLARVDLLLGHIEAQEKKASPMDRQRWQQARRSAQDTRGALLARAGKCGDAVAELRVRTGWRELVFLALRSTARAATEKPGPPLRKRGLAVPRKGRVGRGTRSKRTFCWPKWNGSFERDRLHRQRCGGPKRPMMSCIGRPVA